MKLRYLESIGDVLPGELTADEFVDAVVLRALAGLPDEWRRAFLERARDYLRQRLVESGCRFAAA